MKTKLILMLFLTFNAYSQWINPTGIRLPLATSTLPSPGTKFLGSSDTDVFTFDNLFINNYCFGFYNKTSGNFNEYGVNTYISGFPGIDFFTNSQPSMRISKFGNVGIGLTNPTSKLEINSGTAGLSGLKFTQLNSASIPVFGANISLLGIDNTGLIVKTQSVSPQSVIYLSSYTSIDLAISDLNTNTTIGTLIIDKNSSLNTSLTLNSGKSIKFLNGNVININGKTFTINGAIEAGVYQIFDISNSASSTTGSPKIEYAVPQWWKSSAGTDWTSAIQKAVDFYSRVYFPKENYNISNTILLKDDSSHNLYGEGKLSAFICTTSVYVFKLNSSDTYDKGLIFENLSFNCINGIQLNETTVQFIDNAIPPKYILNSKISSCYFNSSASPGTGIAIQFNKVFDSEVSNNQIYGFWIGVNMRGSDINTISKNRIMQFYNYAILDESFGSFGSQNGIYNNDILQYMGVQDAGAMIKSSSRIITIKDNYLENNSSQKIHSFIDCSNYGLTPISNGNGNGINKSFPLHIDLRGNRLDISAGSSTYSYLIQDDFASLIIDNNKNTYQTTPPSIFISSSGDISDPVFELLKSNHNALIEKEIHINSCSSFRKWNNFNTSPIFSISTNGGLIIDSKNVTTAVKAINYAADPNIYFNPLKFKIQTSQNRITVIDLTEGILNGEKELFKNIKIRITLKGVLASQTGQLYMRAESANNPNFSNVYNTNLTLSDNYTIIEYNPVIDYVNKLYITSGTTDFDLFVKSIELIPILSNPNGKIANANETKKDEILERLNDLESKLKLITTELEILKEGEIKTSDNYNSIEVYPNPVTNILNLNFNTTNNTPFVFSLYDSSGKLLLSENFSNKATNYNVNLSEIIASSYVYKISSSTFVKTGIIIKK